MADVSSSRTAILGDFVGTIARELALAGETTVWPPGLTGRHFCMSRGFDHRQAEPDLRLASRGLGTLLHSNGSTRTFSTEKVRTPSFDVAT